MSKRVRKKAFIGAIIGAVGSIAGAAIQAHQQKQQFEAQQRQQRLAENKANAASYIANQNELANNDMSWAYDKFKPSFRCGGRKRMKANLGKFKSRFDK